MLAHDGVGACQSQARSFTPQLRGNERIEDLLGPDALTLKCSHDGSLFRGNRSPVAVAEYVVAPPLFKESLFMLLADPSILRAARLLNTNLPSLSITSRATPTLSSTACKSASGWIACLDGISRDSWLTLEDELPVSGPGNQTLLDSQGEFAVAFETRALGAR